MAKKAAEPLICKHCKKPVTPNETFAHLQKEHGIVPTSTMEHYVGGATREFVGLLKRAAAQKRR